MKSFRLEKPESTESGDGNSIYLGGAFITGIVVFTGVWLYALDDWGLLFGLLFGWLPALIGGFVAGLLWPLIAVVIVLFFLFFLNS